MNPSVVRKSTSLPLSPKSSSKTFALLVLTSAIAAASNVMADSGNSNNKNELSIKLRNYYQDRRPTDPSGSYVEKDYWQKGKTPIKKQIGWGQGLEVNFDSAYLGERKLPVSVLIFPFTVV